MAALAVGLVMAAGCGVRALPEGGAGRGAGPEALKPLPNPRTAAEKIVNAAKEEVLRGVRYDASYTTLAYPGGDVPADRGACTDVVIRALRAAGYDLQKLIHDDMRRHFRLYPKRYGLRAPDRSIDHRRTPNQVVFLRRFGLELPRGTTGADAASWQPGDIVFWRLPGGLGHVGVCSDERNAAGLPLVLHNVGPQASHQDCLTVWEITDHFRFPKPRRRG
jgi:uncharacterized protein YijF (DUF1287 family)